MGKQPPGSGDGKKKGKDAGASPKAAGGSKAAEQNGGAEGGGRSTLLFAGAGVVAIAAVLAVYASSSPVSAPASGATPAASASSPAADVKPVSAAAPAKSAATGAPAGDPSLRWSPKTLSVVLPCAGEGKFAQRTVESVAASVPGGIGGSILSDIVVVDDGSSPPLTEEFLRPDFIKKYPMTLVRHEKAIGLMGAKSAGAAVAKGDIIVFFDCHVAPQKDWYKEFLSASAENWRRIVVPVITDLDIDTWQERKRSFSFAKCYLTWDADFKWVESEQPHMPVLSGGLLGISRRWWNETGGYDAGMRGWGGENIDQSLRTWLCGGEIISLSKAFVAHMWRQPHDARTEANYQVSAMDAVKNKARAVLGWFGDFADKAGEFQSLNMVGIGSKKPDMQMYRGFDPSEMQMNKDVSNLHEVRDRLSCKPFAWFLWRFRHIYEDGGLLPPETFQLQEATTGRCLTFLGPMGVHPQGSGHVMLLPCNATGLPPHMHPESQRWHFRNKKPATGKCCSALGSWNTDQCITHLGPQGVLSTTVCDVSGRQVKAWELTKGEQRVTADASAKPVMAGGQILFNGKCLVVDKDADPIMLSDTLQSPAVKFAKCKKEGAAPRWKMVAPQVPVETQLYEKALRDNPGLFKDA